MFTSTPTYHETTKKIISIFNTVFNNIHIKSGNGYKRIPIQYGPRDKWLERIRKREELEEEKIGMQLPRMSYEITDISKDTSRKAGNNMNKWSYADNRVQFVDVPYEMSVTLSIMTKNETEMFQIVEQILPVFSPDLTVRAKGLSGPDEKRTNVNVILTSVAPSDEYEGSMEDRRRVMWELTFTVKYSYAGPVSQGKLIREVYVDIFDDPKNEGERITLTVGENDTPDSFSITQTITPIFEDNE